MSFNDLIDDTVKKALNFTNGGSGGISYIYGGSNISVLNPSGATPTISVIDPLVNNEVDTNILTATTAIKSNLIENLTNDELIIKQNDVSSILLNTDGNGGVQINAHNTDSNASIINMDSNCIELSTAHDNYIHLQNDGAVRIGASGSADILLYNDGSTEISGTGNLILTNNTTYIAGGNFILYNADQLHFTNLYSDTDGNLHAVVNDTTDYQLTPPSGGGGTATNIVNDTTDSSVVNLISAQKISDGSFQPIIELCDINTINTNDGTVSVFRIIQKGSRNSTSLSPSVTFSFYDEANHIYLPIIFLTAEDDSGGLVLKNAVNNCILYPDANGDLHAKVSYNGSPIDYQLTPTSTTATNIVSDTNYSFPTVINAVNESTDSGSQSYIRILNIFTQNTITGNNELFTLDQKGASDTVQPSLKFIFQDQDDNFLPFTFQTSTTGGGIKLDNSTNACRLYPDVDGNLHAVVDNYGSPIDYQLTPNTTVSQLLYNGSTDVTPTVISMTNTTDGSFIPNLNVLQASLQSEMGGEVQTNSIFQIAYNGSSTSGGNCDVYLLNQNVTTGVYNRIWVIAPDATDGGFVLTNPANSSACILYCDNLGNLHGLVSSGNIDCLITGLNPFSFNGVLAPTTINQTACPVLINNIDAIPPQNIYVKNNVIVNISINGSVEPSAQESPIVGGIAPDMITLGFNVIFYYSNDVEGIVPLTTTLQLYCSTIFGGSYPISCSFTEVINTGYVDGNGFCTRISIEVIFVNGYNTGADYGFNFNNVNATITPQNN